LGINEESSINGGSLPAGRQGTRPTPLQKKETLAGIELARVFLLGVHKMMYSFFGLS